MIKKIIRDTFEKPFDKGQYIYFVKNLFNKVEEDTFEYWGAYIKDAYKPYIKKYERIGKYQDVDGNKIDILTVNLKKETSLERARTMQRNFIAQYLKDRGEKDGAIVAFYTDDLEDWRFSLVKMEYKLTQTKTGRPKGEEELTPARRYSFLVGENEPNHTAQQQLVPLLQDDINNPTLAQLESAFNIEKVTKEFFEKYRELYHQVQESVDEIIKKDSLVQEEFTKKNIDTVDFSKKLLGQIIFLYFLQKKGWLGVPSDKPWGEGDRGFLRTLFNRSQKENKNFSNDYLEVLFYNTLNNPRQNEVDPSYSRFFDCRIPFLNGGLFEPIQDYDWKHTDINIPNKLFSNEEKTKEGDIGIGILDVFDRYNFTVKEDEPLDKEVAIDPEMLGKVFENLLEVKDRKSKGSYYTPREIVHYMCQESLINYLDTELNLDQQLPIEDKGIQLKLIGKQDPYQQGLPTQKYSDLIPKEDIENFIRYGEFAIEYDTAKEEGTKTYKHKIPENIRGNAKIIDEKLENIRICDPAVGSGAFLVGMMTEIVKARNTLTTYLSLRGAEAMKQSQVPTPVIASEAKQSRSIYHFKRDAIQNCLYGVDIDPSAVDIAKLRLWLSLVVDEEDIRQIKPLPNLDYKIVCGNSLLGVKKDLLNAHLFEELEKVKLLLFNETDTNKKQEYKKGIDKLIKEITNNDENFDFEVYFSEVFHEKKGFDIVIANPPYLGEKGHKEMFREIKKANLVKFYQGKMDLFYFFFHLALNLGKQNSSIAFITTNYYPTAMGAKKLRQDFKERATIDNLINFNELKIFESALGQHNMITILEKSQNENAIAQTCITQRQGLATNEILQQMLNGNDTETPYYKVAQKDLYDGDEYYIRLTGSSEISDNPIQKILDKIKKQGILLGIICNVNNGIFAGADTLNELKKKKYNINNANIGEGIFILTRKEVNSLNLDTNEKRIIKPLFKNSDIYKYFTNNKNNLFIINLRYTDRPNINNYPNIKRHLLKFKSLLSDRPRTGTLESAFNNGYWYVMSTSRKVDMESEKIVAPQRSKTNTFGYNEFPWYAASDVFFITEKDKSVSLKYILALINSKLYYLWLYHRGKRKGETLELIAKPLSEIPIKKISREEQQPLIDLVDKILAITKNLSACGHAQADDDYLINSTKQSKVKEYEHQIDQRVYKLYNLTDEEIKIVENFSKQ